MDLTKKEIEEIRWKYLKRVIVFEIWKKWLTQPEVAEKIWVNFRNLHPYIWWPRIKTDDEYYDLIFKEVLWFDEEKIKKIKLEAREQQIKAEFWSEIWIKSLTIEDNWQEPITTTEEAEKVLFKINWIRPTEEALRSIRLAIDMVKFEQNKNK